MLSIMLGESNDRCIMDVNGHFNLFKEPSWFEDEFVQQVIMEIDKSEVIEGEFIKSPIFGGISPEKLSSGAKALILMKMEPALLVYATRCGNNCSELICELAEQQDITILLHHCMKFPEKFKARVIETGREVSSHEEFVEEYYRYKHQVKGF